MSDLLANVVGSFIGYLLAMALLTWAGRRSQAALLRERRGPPAGVS